MYSGRRTGTEEFSASRLKRIGAHGLSSRSSFTRDMRNDEDEFDMDFCIMIISKKTNLSYSFLTLIPLGSDLNIL